MFVEPRWRFAAGAAVLGGLVVVGQPIALPSPWWFWTRPYLVEFVAGMAVAAAFRRGWRLHPGVTLALALGRPRCSSRPRPFPNGRSMGSATSSTTCAR